MLYFVVSLRLNCNTTDSKMQQKVLITGASGFIGSFLVEGGLERGMQVWAGVRQTSSRRYLQDERIRLAELDLTDTTRLEQQLLHHREEHGGWDCVIHCAGVTKCIDEAEFEMANYWATRHFIEMMDRLDMRPKQFIYISSLSIFGPIREHDYSEILETDTPQPNTAYGRSKWLTEKYLIGRQDYPYLIYRPTGVYGPRERDYFLMAKSIKNHLDFMAGFKRQDITFVYVKDLVDAIYLGVEKGTIHRAYFVSDGAVYSSRDFSNLIRKELGNPFLIRFVCPLVLLKLLSFVAEKFGKFTKRPSTLNRDKYKIMKQRNWRCDISPLQRELGYEPRYQLERGVKEIISWYTKEKWL